MTEKARRAGITNVVFITNNNTHYRLSKKFLKSLLPKDFSNLDSYWINYYSEENIHSHYSIILSLKNILLSPELLKEKEFTETRKIKDGWEYVLDQNGNVKKDSLGNDIKKPRIITVKCKVRQTIQRRDAIIQAELNYLDNTTKKIIKSIPLQSNYFIENTFAVAFGDIRALTPETKQLLNSKPILMPGDIEFIHQAGDVLKKAIIVELKKNKHLIK